MEFLNMLLNLSKTIVISIAVVAITIVLMLGIIFGLVIS